MDIISSVLGTAALMAGVLVLLTMAALPWFEKIGGQR